MNKKYSVTVRTGDLNYYHELVILRNGQEMSVYTDCGQPEDNSFFRDYDWIQRELMRAYDAGVSDGVNGQPGRGPW